MKVTLRYLSKGFQGWPRNLRTHALLHVVVPLSIGGAIYICWRDPSLWLFDWVGYAGLAATVDGLRQLTLPYAAVLPRWVLYSLPDALWVYAAIMFMDRIWSGDATRKLNRRIWLCSGPLLAIVIELGQLTKLIPGNFDPNDLLLSAAATGMAALVINNHRKSQTRIEKGTEYVQANKNELAVGSRA